MTVKGFDQLRAHVPDLNSPIGRMRVALYVVASFALVTVYFILSDRIPSWSIDSQIVVLALGFLILRLFFTRKKAYQQKYGELAYRNAFAHYGIPGLALVLSAVAHAGYMNGPFIPGGWWTLVFLALGWFMVCIGAALWIRAIFAFGVDNLMMVYVYFPEESKIVDLKIYSILRHPIYAAALRFGIGLALLNGNANSIAFAILFPLGLFGWIRLVEEKELIERFGDSYIEYRKRVPAFFPKFNDLDVFSKFLVTGK